ncbi:MAG: hypothetical protein QM496_18335 [Verrucomicrobiota bacterium]
MRLVRLRAKGRDGKMRTIYLATTLTDTQKYPTEEIALLYAERWKIEVKSRNIKTGLAGKNPELKNYGQIPTNTSLPHVQNLSKYSHRDHNGKAA